MALQGGPRLSDGPLSPNRRVAGPGVRDRVVGAPITPEVARLAAEVRVEFTASEPLEFDPEVVLGVGPGRALGLLERAGARYAFAYSPAGGEPQGEAVPLTATLIDTSGNVARAVALGSVVFDFSVPVVADIRSIPPAELSRTSTGSLELTVSEPLPEPPAVTVSGTGAALVVVGDAAGPIYRYQHAVSEADEAGPVGIDAVAIDAAGNVGQAHADGVFIHDFVPPTAELTTPEGALRAGQVVSVLVALSEPLASHPGMTMTRLGDAVELERVVRTEQRPVCQAPPRPVGRYLPRAVRAERPPEDRRRVERVLRVHARQPRHHDGAV